MKGIKFLAILFLLFVGLSPLCAEIMDNISFSTTTDFAYYPKSDFVSGETHFAPITGPFDGLEARTTGEMDYRIPTPLGSHWLLSDADLVLGATFELSPVSLKPGVKATFTPLPFLVFSAGAVAGTGWNLMGLQGMGKYDAANISYTDLPSFGNWFLKWWADGTFQFDFGAIWAGDWTHLQTMYTYQVYYETLTGLSPQELWIWQCTGERVNGLKNYQSLIVAYQMPLVLSRVGIMVEWDGYYFDSVFANSDFNGSFKEINLSPLAQFSLTEKDTLACLLGFKMRRSFKESHTDTIEEPFLTKTGSEWFFNRLAFSWTHEF